MASLLTDARSFDEVLELCGGGHSQNVDMLVSDIYSSDYEKIGMCPCTFVLAVQHTTC